MQKTMNRPQTVKLFKDQASAEKAYKKALERGFSPDAINVIMSENTKNTLFPDVVIRTTIVGDKSMDGLALGGAVGGSIVGIASAIAAIGATITIPGLNLIIASPLAAGLVGAGFGSITGGVLGALIGSGMPEERIKEYETGLKSGGIVLTVTSSEDLSNEELEKDWSKL